MPEKVEPVPPGAPPARPGRRRWRRPSVDSVLLVVSLAGLGVGAVLHLAGHPGGAEAAWAATTAVGLGPAVWWVVDAARHHRLGVDVIAVLALAGTLAVGEYLAGAVISVMLATGRTLESWAQGRASRELHRLVERTPRVAHVRMPGGLADAPVEDVRVGDLLVVKPGEVVPVDGRVETGVAVIDESALTGEALPVEHPAGDPVRSGTVNSGAPLELRATTTSADSTYSGLVALVRAAEASSAPAVRMADRYALWFLAVSLVGAAAAGLLAGDLTRAVAVLVVATPCPLILAVPVALVSGLSLAARRGVVIKGGAVLERLARSRILLFDKTGTLTLGRPTLVEVAVPDSGPAGDEVLRLAASLDQVSPHILAAAIVRSALARDLHLGLPEEVVEVPGKGARGLVDGRAVAVGSRSWVGGDCGWAVSARRRADREGHLTVFVALDGRCAGVLVFADPVRADARRTLRNLRRDGIARIVMVTGDRSDVAESVGVVIGVDEVMAERSPAEKLEAVALARQQGPTVMVGDGINDAPALASADVGVALGARGATASSEAADVVLTVDRLDRLGEAVVIARRSLRIATESVVAGIGMSLVAMLVAGLGLLPPTWGAITQEAIDVVVILNAMRALATRRIGAPITGPDAAIASRFSSEHGELRPRLEDLRRAADAIGSRPDREAFALVRDVERWLEQDLLPHEMAEQETLYPMLARVLGGEGRTSTMSRAHNEIAHLIRRLGVVIADSADPPGPDDLADIRRLLYGLYAVLSLHFDQEEESYLYVSGDDTGEGSAGGDGPMAGIGPAAAR